MLFLRLQRRAPVQHADAHSQRHEPAGYDRTRDDWPARRSANDARSGPLRTARDLRPRGHHGPVGACAGPLSSGTSYRVPTAAGHGTGAVEPPRIEVCSISDGPQLSPTPSVRPEKENLTTALPVLQATYFQLLPSPPAVVPAYSDLRAGADLAATRGRRRLATRRKLTLRVFTADGPPSSGARKPDACKSV